MIGLFSMNYLTLYEVCTWGVLCVPSHKGLFEDCLQLQNQTSLVSLATYLIGRYFGTLLLIELVQSILWVESQNGFKWTNKKSPFKNHQKQVKKLWIQYLLGCYYIRMCRENTFCLVPPWIWMEISHKFALSVVHSMSTRREIEAFLGVLWFSIFFLCSRFLRF